MAISKSHECLNRSTKRCKRQYRFWNAEILPGHPTKRSVVRLQLLLYPKVTILVHFFTLGSARILAIVENRNVSTSPFVPIVSVSLSLAVDNADLNLISII